jgi:integrase
MRKPTPRVVSYTGSETSRFVVEGLRVNGKRVRKFFRTRREGEAWLRKTMARVRREGESAIHMPESLRVEAVVLSERLKPYGATLTQAVEHYIAHSAAIARSRAVTEVVTEFLPAMAKLNMREMYLKDLRNRLARFEREFGQRIVADIRRPEIADWLDQLEVAIQTRKNFRTVLKTFFEYAIGREYCVENPVEKIPAGKPDRPPPEVFTSPEMRALLEHAPADLIPWLAIGAFAGLRAAEVERLDWSEISLPERLIKLPATKSKTHKKRNVEIADNLAAWLAPLAQASGPVANVDRIRVARDATVKAAGLPAWRQNALRHSFASYHVAHYQNVPKTAYQLGHSSPKMIGEHYDAVVEPAVAAEWWQIMPPPDYGNVIAFRREEVANA